MRIFIICPVRGASIEEDAFLDAYVRRLEREGHAVHLPKRDTDQTDPVGYRICRTNREGILNANEVHVYYNRDSVGSKFDLGMAFMAQKPVKLINRDDVQPTPHKSFENVLLELDRMYRTARIASDVKE